MDGLWIWYVAVAILTLLLTLGATTTIALRGASRARFGDLLQRLGRHEPVERLAVVREQLALVAAIVRTTCSLALVLLVLHVLEGESYFEAWWPTYAETARYLTAFVGALLLILVFGVAIANALARYLGDRVLTRFVPVAYLLLRLLSPAVWFLQLGDGFVRRLAGVPKKSATSASDEFEQEILDVVTNGEIHGAVDEEEKDMIESVIELRDTTVQQIMTPRTEIVALEGTASLTEVKQLIRTEGHSRIPIHDDTIDSIVGVLYAKDLLHVEGADEFRPGELMRKAFFIPETKPLRDLLHEFQENKVHIAIVLDEYGGTAGLVTIEDILEELVGEITDEYEPDEPATLQRIDEHTVEVDARMRVEEINDELELTLPESDDYETIGGLMFTSLGTIPPVGAELQVADVEMRVISAEARKINRIRLVCKSRRESPPQSSKRSSRVRPRGSTPGVNG